MNFKIENRIPDAKSWRALRASVHFTDFSEDILEFAREKSLFGVSIYADTRLIGMGRVTGDGATSFYLQDIIVDEAYRGNGIGSIIVKNLLQQIRRDASKDAFVALFSSAGTESFYAKAGFVIREKTGKGSGMYLPTGLL